MPNLNGTELVVGPANVSTLYKQFEIGELVKGS
jgi:hypothetical protein